ncbi:MAG TPA: hypothetical protein VLT61_12430 [Anaeromyxobacteraceae bacterium]|nr:hypothetical protein [Anaeromyxobacteraceae bacterium]
MSRPVPSAAVLAAVMVVAAVAVAVAELAIPGGGRGALLVTLVLWTAIAQGSVAAVAAAEYTGARWVEQVRGELLAPARMLPLLLVLFVFLWPQLDLYPWAAAPGAWLNRPFFAGRNVALLAAAALLASLFAARAERRDPSARRFAVAYLVVYAASQSLVAFDWVMSLAYPWVSSMFGLYFMVEALYAGVALAGVLFLLLGRPPREAGGARWEAAGRDAGLLLFGFSVLWGGLFFAQFLLIWYGNLPEEVSLVAARLAGRATRPLVPAFIALCWGVPFFLLISAWAKRSALAVGIASGSVLLGLAAERLMFMLPALPLRFGVLALENALLVAVWLVLSLRRRSPAGQAAARASGGGPRS